MLLFVIMCDDFDDDDGDDVSCDDCLEVRREIIRTVLCCIVY